MAETVLLVASAQKGAEAMAMLLKGMGYGKVVIVPNGAQARRDSGVAEYDLILVNAPLIDEFGMELAIELTETTSASVILIVKNEMAEEITGKVELHGILVVPKPLNRSMFVQTLKLAAASRRRLMGLHKKNQKLQDKIEEIRLVDRAKWLLTERQGMTEMQAHRYIEKCAMDTRVTRKEVAKQVLDQYA